MNQKLIMLPFEFLTIFLLEMSQLEFESYLIQYLNTTDFVNHLR